MPPPSSPPTVSSSSSPSTTTSQRYFPPSTVLLIYPATLVLGSLFSVLSPTAQPPSTSQETQQQQQQQPINYFARKNNVFNIYFVKVGWAWMTLAFAAILLSQPAVLSRPRRLAQGALRYTLATLVWYATTQWFFGPAIIDRSFVFTGGRCEQILRDIEDWEGNAQRLRTHVTAAACKASGGAWRGGHDVSGHVFMLVLMTAMLGFEIFGIVEAWAVAGAGSVSEGLRRWTVRFVGLVVGLSWWMLLMTAIWFHTWLEKLNGLLIALATVYALYILPRRLIPWRNAVGIPGV